MQVNKKALTVALLFSMIIATNTFNTNVYAQEKPALQQGNIATNTQSKFKNIIFDPDLIADIAEKISPSVVNIDVENVQQISTNMNGFPGDFFQQFFGMVYYYKIIHIPNVILGF